MKLLAIKLVIIIFVTGSAVVNALPARQPDLDSFSHQETELSAYCPLVEIIAEAVNRFSISAIKSERRAGKLAAITPNRYSAHLAFKACAANTRYTLNQYSGAFVSLPIGRSPPFIA